MMPLFRRADPDPEVQQAEATGDSVRAQVGLLSLQIHRELEALELAIKRDLSKNEGAIGERRPG